MKWYNEGMDISTWLKEWAEPLSAGATLAAVVVALGIGVASILQTLSLQKREREERLLKEIIEWAQRVIDLIPQDVLIGIDSVAGLKLMLNLQVLVKEGSARLNTAKLSIDEEAFKALAQAITEATDELENYRNHLPPQSSGARETLISKLAHVKEETIGVKAKLGL